jgi:hypothetical protein
MENNEKALEILRSWVIEDKTGTPRKVSIYRADNPTGLIARLTKGEKIFPDPTPVTPAVERARQAAATAILELEYQLEAVRKKNQKKKGGK